MIEEEIEVVRGQTPAYDPFILDTSQITGDGLTNKQTPMRKNTRNSRTSNRNSLSSETRNNNTKNIEDDDYDNDDVSVIIGNCNILMDNWKFLNK